MPCPLRDLARALYPWSNTRMTKTACESRLSGSPGLFVAGRRALARTALLCAGLLATLATAIAEDGPCRAQVFDGAPFTLCRIDPELHEIVLFSKDENGSPYAQFSRLPSEIDGAELIFAMNAGMYHADLAPVGLHVEDGEQLKAINTRSGPGNFHMLPNGVFFMQGNRAGVLTTPAFVERGIKPDLATQSGPMLVIDGALHPRFIRESSSLRRRNGVCVEDSGVITFAISDRPVNFHHFGRLFRDQVGCRNALYLDGTMSSLHAPALGRSDMIRPMGPIIAAYRRP